MGLEEAWKTEAAAARAAFAAREQSRTRKKGSVAQLDASNFAPSLAAVERVGVVKFFSPQCPACRRLAPVYEAAAKRFSGQADFFEVNYKQAQQVCREERVLLLPMVHLYVPRAGCVDRFVLSYKRRKRLEEKLDGLLAGDGERLDRLRELDPAALAPLVRLKELLGAVQAVRRAPELLRGAAGDGWVTEQQTEEMQSVFRALDRNGDGVLDAEELAAACEALGMPFSSEEELRRVVTAADGDASTDTVDERAFLRLMARRASEEVTDADALLSSFRALDVDGNGLLDAGELLEALSGVSLALGGEEAAGGAVSRAGIEELLRAFGVDDESGSVDYETFVSMVAGRGS